MATDYSLQVQLEAFQANLHGCRILLQGPFEVGKYPPILEAIQNIREPFRRKILLTSHTEFITNTIKLSYDTVFRVQNNVDWSLILNYIHHLIGQSGGSPLLIVVEDLEIPDAFFAKLQAVGGGAKTTLLHFTTIPVKLRTGLAALYDTIFFPVQSDTGAQSAHHTFNVLQGVFRPTWTFHEFREILTEIRAAGAGLCWTRVGNSGGVPGKSGNIFWYDPVHSLQTHELDKGKISRLLKWIADEML